MISLYYAPDNASLIVRILLEEAGLPYEAILVDRRAQGQNSAEYLRLNPNGLIPVCIINNEPVFETAAIVLSLADTHNTFNVSIDDPQRPQFLKWLFFLSNSLHSDLRQRFYPEKYVGSGADALEAFNKLTLERLQQRIGIMEAAYGKSESHYLMGSDPTLIDIYLAVCLRWAQLYPGDHKGEIDSAEYPAIHKMLLLLEGRAAMVRACEKEGIAGTFFSSPDYADPPEGVAL